MRAFFAFCLGFAGIAVMAVKERGPTKGAGCPACARAANSFDKKLYKFGRGLKTPSESPHCFQGNSDLLVDYHKLRELKSYFSSF